MATRTERSMTPDVPARTTIATYDHYADAQRAVDFLSDQGFAVERLTIVGSGLRTIEQVTGRVTVARAALTGALQGALIGAVFTLLFGVFFTVTDGYFALLLYAVFLGALVGAAFGAIGHAATGGRRDFASTTGLQAERYEVQADAEVAAEAKDFVLRLPERPGA